MNQRVTAAEEEVNKARRELDKARTKLEMFEADQKVPSKYDGTANEYFDFLTQQVKERADELKGREAALIELARIEIEQE